jgi:CBS domain containing-hemolysin-like protein
MNRPCLQRAATHRWAIAAAAAALLAALPAHASFLSGDALAKAANIVAIVVLVVVPIAHKNHHPQTKAIQCLCLLSLVFGGMLWPLAWLWAYTKPVLHKMAYGTDKADEYYDELAATSREEADRLRADVARLRADLEHLIARGGAPAELELVRDRLAAIEPHLSGKAEGAG